jgi:immunoglobulin I-set domain protein
MPTFRNFRWILPPVLAGLLLLAAASTQAWAAGSYGELLRFNGVGTGALKGHKFDLEEEVHAFGVDPSEGNSIFVGDEKSEASEEEFRLQKYTSAGAFQGEALLKPGGSKLPTGISYVEDLDGVAVDPANEIVYLLVTYARSNNDAIDFSKEVAGAIYAFSTKPNGSNALVPAKDANQTTGLLASIETLKANSETQGQALLEPSGITVDPKTHEVMVLGEVDKGSSEGMHVALDRVSEAGALISTYVDPERYEGIKEPDSPVVSQNGTVFFEDDDEIEQIPAGFTSAPKAIYHIEEPEGFVEGLFKEELIEFGENAEESHFGGGLAIISEGGADEGRLIADAEVHEVSESGAYGDLSYTALALHYLEEGEKVKVAEIGWTGGQPGEEGTAGSCAIGFRESYPQVAGATGNQSFVLSPASGEVIEFGPSGEHCATAKAATSGLEATIHGIKVVDVNTTTPVVMSAKIVGANVLSVEWEFEGGAKETTTTQSGSVLEVEQTQIAEVTHKFTVAGKVTVKATIHTDDLATPTIPVSTTLTVEPPSGAPVVKPQPASQVVVEGENATFKTGATGEPTPTVQWEQSVDHGTTWADVAAGTTGGTTDTLTVTSTTISENENEYRATFTNVVGTTTSAVATLTVETKKAHEEKLAEEKRKEEEAAAKKRVEEEAAAAKKRAEEEAAGSKKRAEEEAAAAANKRAQEEAAAKKKAEEEAASHQVLNFKEGSPTATVAGTSLTVSASGAVTVKVSCAAGVKTCTGTVTLRTLGAVSARVASGAAEAKASVLTLASGSFSLTGGQAKAITLHLSAKARKLLAHSHSLRAKATIVAHNAEGASHTTLATVTLRAAKKK